MKIQLNKIKPSPNPIRKTWDEQKMQDLRWSLMEEGQVEPIGVREEKGAYVIVWGHRRTEAARRAGWDEIEAVVVPADEVNNLIQAGIENLAREDMTLDDKVDWARRLIDLGLSQREIARRTTVSQGSLHEWLLADGEPEVREILKAGFQPYEQDDGLKKVKNIVNVLGDDLGAKKAVATKVSSDGLTRDQTRAVAEAYRDAPTPEVKQKVLEVPIISRDTAADILRRSIHRVELETGAKVVHEANEWDREREERRTMQAWDFAVKEFLDMTKMYADLASKVPSLIKYGKYSPEAARFAIRKIDTLIDLLKTCREELGGVK